MRIRRAIIIPAILAFSTAGINSGWLGGKCNGRADAQPRGGSGLVREA